MGMASLSEEHSRIEAKIDLLLTLIVKSLGEENMDVGSLTEQQRMLLTEALDQTRKYWWDD